MVIITDRNGQLCNRIFHFSYFIANSIEHKYRVMYPCFDQYKDLFEATESNFFFDLYISLKITPFRLLDRQILKYLKKNKPAFPGAFYLNVTANHESDIY